MRRLKAAGEGTSVVEFDFTHVAVVFNINGGIDLSEELAVYGQQHNQSADSTVLADGDAYELSFTEGW